MKPPCEVEYRESSVRVSPLPLNAHIKVIRLMLKTQRLPVRYNAGEHSLKVSPLPLDARRRVSRLMMKTERHPMR